MTLQSIPFRKKRSGRADSSSPASRVAAILAAQFPRGAEWLWLLGPALALFLILRSDLAHLDAVSRLSLEGSPPPARDAASPTGYVLGQRHFLGSHERGETYRWIATTQDLIARGPAASEMYLADNAPEGRPQLAPRLYGFWLAGIAWALQVVTGEQIGLAVEQAALWEPVIVHILALVSLVGFLWIHYGTATAAVAALFFALFPPLSGQFLPGVLTPRTGALVFATYVVALTVAGARRPGNHPAFSVRAAIAASLALWLDPAIGFPAILISAAFGAAALILDRQARPAVLSWAFVGAAFTLVAWLIDQNPWAPAAGELRYIHPLYGLAWLGLGLGLDGWRNVRTPPTRRKRDLTKLAAATTLLSYCGYVQFSTGYKGWLHPGIAIRRFTSLDETVVHESVVDWLIRASPAEIVFLLTPIVGALLAIGFGFMQKRDRTSEPSLSPWLAATVFVAVLVLAFFRVRWGVVASVLALPLIAQGVVRAPLSGKLTTVTLAALFLFGLFAWERSLPLSLQKRPPAPELRAADVEALIHRHFSHWLATHTPGQDVTVLAPPDLSDSLVFHGGCRALISTAWESYPGHVAASRILSAPETSEAEAVLERQQITHVVLSSWDRVLPLLVKATDSPEKDTFYARLQRWVHPRTLRALPYRLPASSGYLDQVLAVFKVVPPQDEALSLSRLAEYFVEMQRSEPAALVASALAQDFPDDPNATIARALVYELTGNASAFEREVSQLAADAAAGRSPFSWDRRVQRAIVLALGRRNDLVRSELSACIAAATTEDLFELTPLQAYRLRTLAARFRLEFKDASLDPLLAALSAEFSPRTGDPR